MENYPVNNIWNKNNGIGSITNTSNAIIENKLRIMIFIGDASEYHSSL